MEKLSVSPNKRNKSPDDPKYQNRPRQPRQKSNTKRFNSTNTHIAAEDAKKNLIASLCDFSEYYKTSDKYLSLYESFRPKLKKNFKEHRKLSPYSGTKYITLAERSPKILPKVKNRAKVDLEAIQNYFFEFQAKSKLLLKQLEKNVLG